MQPAELEIVDRLLGTTRSVRRRLDLARPVEPEVLEVCIDLAVQAPTGAPGEGWRFVVVTEPEAKRALGELYRGALERFARRRLEQAQAAGESPPPIKSSVRGLAERLHEFPALVLVCAEGRPAPDDVAQQVAFYGSILPAAWSLMLALRSRGLGTTWTSLLLTHETEAARILAIPEGVTQTVLFPIAYMRDAVLDRAERRPAREVTYWNRWGLARDGDVPPLTGSRS